ncbi:MAG: TetR/AcrR family transcriptional regulator [Proteobacteria bacterium]|nr:TetR/AcrR family transcriptional regulator [Pseudomonadota bacterium]
MIDIKRKKPTQLRSKAAVDAILEAATRILLSKGMNSLTTNHVAELAGVSIGSLYQYFSNKESIVVGLIEHHIKTEQKRISTIMDQLENNPTCQKSKMKRKSNIRLVVKEFIDIHAENLELSRILHTQTQKFSIYHSLESTTSFFTRRLHSLLNKVDKTTPKENFTRAYILANFIDSLIQKTLIEQPKLFTKPEFIDELVNLSMSYLQPT